MRRRSFLIPGILSPTGRGTPSQLQDRSVALFQAEVPSIKKPPVFSNPRLFKNPVMRLQQLSPISDRERDHKSFRVYFGDYNVVCANDMMQANTITREDGTVRSNTGFPGFSETKADYQARLVRIAQSICNDIDANTFCVMRQEFAIQEADIALVIAEIKKRRVVGWENPTLHISQFGVMTCFKNESFEQFFVRDEKAVEILGELDIRCQVFRSSDSYALVNMHVPFAKTEDAFQSIVYPLLTKQLESDCHFNCVDFVGDKNLESETQLALSQKVFEKIRTERMAAGKNPITIISYLATSRDGHLKDKNGKPELVSVDSCQRFVMFESAEYEFHCVSEKQTSGKFKYILSLLLGGSLITGDALLNDAAMLTELSFAQKVLAGCSDELTEMFSPSNGLSDDGRDSCASTLLSSSLRF